MKNLINVYALALMLTLISQCKCELDQVCSLENEVYMSCGKSCPETCETLMTPNENQMCTMQCVVGCFCKDGFVRNTVTRQCVKPHDCKMPRDNPGNHASSLTTLNGVISLWAFTLLCKFML